MRKIKNGEVTLTLVLYLLLFSISAYLCTSCNKIVVDVNKGEDSFDGIANYVLADDAVLLSEDESLTFTFLADNIIFQPSSTSMDAVHEPGTIIICPITDKTPSGLLARVVSVETSHDGYSLKIEPVPLTKAFKELTVRMEIDLSSFMDSVTDVEGNPVDAEIVTSDIWEELMGTDNHETKTSGNTDISIKIPIKKGWFSGNVFMCYKLNVDIDISKKMLNRFDIAISKKTGMAGALNMTVNSEQSVNLIDAQYKFKPFLIPGTPIVIRPTMYMSYDIKAEGTINLKSDVRFVCENQRYSMSYGGDALSFNSEKLNDDNSYINFISLDADANLALSALYGGKFALYDDRLLAFGIEGSVSHGYNLHNEIMMDNSGLLIQNPEVDVVPSLDATVYCESFLLDKCNGIDDGRLEYTWDFDLPKFTMSTLPQFIDVQQNQTDGILKVSSAVDDMCLLECSDKGFALFEVDEESPLEHISLVVTPMSKVFNSDEVSFHLPDSKKEYYARSYVVADDRYYYGPEMPVDNIWVDLGLSSGILWAKYNVGATSPEEYGDYYAWGETEPKSSYTIYNYKYYNRYYIAGELYTERIDIGSQISGTNYDAAHIHWGTGARMPTASEVFELINNCAKKIGTYNGVQGCYFTGINGNDIFLPMAGYHDKEGYCTDFGNYWCGSDNEYGPFSLYFFIDESAEYKGLICDCDEDTTPHVGFSVRPVKDAY